MVGYLTVENKLYEIQMWLVQHERWTLDTARRYIAPLNWYVATGRASTEFLKSLVSAKTFVVGRVLVNTYGNYDETIQALRRKFNIG